jgi:hypothetical protein
MLKVLSEDVRECHRRAEECARQAKAQLNPEHRRNFLDLELRWLKLARWPHVHAILSSIMCSPTAGTKKPLKNKRNRIFVPSKADSHLPV